MPDTWVVARTKPNREKWAAENVAKQGYEFYFPCVEVVGKREARSEPLFRSYLFVHTPGPWRFLMNTFGISSVVLFCNSPATIPQSEIDKLRKTEVEGCVVLPSKKTSPRFEGGAPVRIRGGMFSGYIGLYEGMDARLRERVLLDFLGRKTTMFFAPELVEAA